MVQKDAFWFLNMEVVEMEQSKQTMTGFGKVGGQGSAMEEESVLGGGTEEGRKRGKWGSGWVGKGARLAYILIFYLGLIQLAFSRIVFLALFSLLSFSSPCVLINPHTFNHSLHNNS